MRPLQAIAGFTRLSRKSPVAHLCDWELLVALVRQGILGLLVELARHRQTPKPSRDTQISSVQTHSSRKLPLAAVKQYIR